MADLLIRRPKMVATDADPIPVIVPALNLYCWPHRAVHDIDVADVEVLVYALGVMVVDGYKLGDDSTRHSPDCPIDVIRLGRHPEGYAEHAELQGVECREQL